MIGVDDWQVLVRDRNLTRVGVLVGADLADFTVCPTASGVGAWSVKLPAQVRRQQSGPLVPHRMCERLRQPGHGIVVSFRGETVFSGPMDAARETVSPDSPAGEWEISGPSDEVVLEDALAWPDPARSTAQTARYANDVQTAAASTLIASYVRRNIGEEAPASRREALARMLSTAGVGTFGTELTKSPRYQNLLELCQEIAAAAGIVFRVLDVDGVLQLTVLQGRDRTAAVRWTVDDGFLDELTSDLGAPGITRPIVAGQGEGAQRQIATPTTPAAIAEEAEWGRRTEAFVDQRQTDDPVELTQKGLEVIQAASSGLEVTPSPLSISGWPERWDLGDLVTVRTSSHGDLVYPVTEVPIHIGPDGVTVSAVLGTIADDTTASQSVSSRVSNMERNAEAPAATPTGLMVPFAGAEANVPAGWLLCDGRAVSRSTYATLFTVTGTRWGSGNGVSTFNVPDTRGRAIVGVDAASTEFTIPGKVYGTKTHTLTAAELPNLNAASAGAHTHSSPLGQRFITTNRDVLAKRAGSSYTSGAWVPAVDEANVVSTENPTASAGAHTHVVNAGGGAHNNVQPSLAAHYIIKT